jgi:hypothetical protein
MIINYCCCIHALLEARRDSQNSPEVLINNESENDFMDNLYDHGILFRYIVGFKEQMKKIVIFKPYVSLIITGSVK